VIESIKISISPIGLFAISILEVASVKINISSDLLDADRILWVVSVIMRTSVILWNILAATAGPVIIITKLAVSLLIIPD